MVTEKHIKSISNSCRMLPLKLVSQWRCMTSSILVYNTFVTIRLAPIVFLCWNFMQRQCCTCFYRCDYPPKLRGRNVLNVKNEQRKFEMRQEADWPHCDTCSNKCLCCFCFCDRLCCFISEETKQDKDEGTTNWVWTVYLIIPILKDFVQVSIFCLQMQ